jgi:hypothetical protein
MHIAICYWGICRSTDKTIDSIKTNVYEPLTAAGHIYDVFVHTFSVTDLYTNTRAGENGIRLNNTLHELLDPSAVEVEDQKNVDLTLNLDAYRTRGDPWMTLFKEPTFDNHIRSLYSLNRVTQLWVTSPRHYDRVIYLRPDVLYLNPLDTRWLEIGPDECAMPDFHRHRRHPVNDRFALLHPRSALIYGRRFEKALAYSTREKLHSETYLEFMLTANNIRPVYIPFRFRRVRANGRVIDDDVTPPCIPSEIVQ